MIGTGLRAMYLALGFIMLALGFVGAFLPVMPTTIFLILAVWCFARSSPRLEKWMLEHPRFGKGLRQWREQGAVPLRAKVMAVGGMLAGYVLLWFTAAPGPGAAALAAVAIAASALYVVSRPEPRPRDESVASLE